MLLVTLFELWRGITQQHVRSQQLAQRVAHTWSVTEVLVRHALCCYSKFARHDSNTSIVTFKLQAPLEPRVSQERVQRVHC
jgi:hypothetical protein